MNKLDIIDTDKDFQKTIEDIISNKKVQEMNNYMQHRHISCYMHCYEVSYECYIICKHFGLDYKSAARAAMVHDMFLYNWMHSKNYLHGIKHPHTACENACKEFNLNEKEQDIIKKHMWPLTIIPPKYIEGFILTLVDKYYALVDLFFYDYINSIPFLIRLFYALHY